MALPVNQFEITRRVRYGNDPMCSWLMRLSPEFACELDWDGMLGTVARIGSNVCCGLRPHDITDADYWREDYTLRCTRVESIWWTVELLPAGRFIDRLTPDEMLGVVAAHTVAAKQLFGGFRTYAERMARWRGSREPKVEIAGLLEVL